MTSKVYDDDGRSVRLADIIDLVQASKVKAPSARCEFTPSLRDQLAMAALTGICASGPDHMFTNSRLATEAYDLADAMLEERGKKL